MAKHLRLARLIELMLTIKHHSDWGPKKLADFFEISEKRLYDDLNELNAAGVPIVYNGEGYSYLNRPTLPNSQLTIDEVLSLWMNVAVLKKSGEDIYSATLKGAAEKLLEMLPEETRKKLIEITGNIPQQTPRSKADINDILSFLNSAIIDRKTVKITYYAYSKDAVTVREVDPYGLIHRGTGWYMIGFCRFRKEIRTFRVNRMKEFQRTGRIFDVPGDFQIENYVSGSWVAFQGEEVEVEIHFSKKLAPLIEENRWHDNQRISKNEDGSIFFSTKVKGLLEIRRWIMSWGEGVRVIKPEMLREEIARHSSALLKEHETG